MAKAILDSMFTSISGRVGDLVFHHRADGKTIVCRRPQPSRTKPTAGQLASRANFRQAAAYGRAAMADPPARAYYAAMAKAKGTAVFAEAVRDYFNPPAIEHIDVATYRGRRGDRITGLASDGATAVRVAIRDASHAVLEQGTAVLEKRWWTYTGTVDLPRRAPVTIDVTAKNRAGKEGQKIAAFRRR